MPPFRILLLHAGTLGDCVLAIHFARMLDVSLPLMGGEVLPLSVTLAARSSITQWAARNGLIDRGMVLDEITQNLWRPHNTPPNKTWTDFLNSFETVVSLLGDSYEPVSANLQRDCPSKPYCIDPRPTEPLRHIVDQWLDRLDPPLRRYREALSGHNNSAQGNALSSRPGDRKSPEEALSLNPQVRTKLSQRCRSNDRPIVLIHPGSGGQSKCCDLETLETLIPALERNNLTPAWIIGPDEMERLGHPYARRLESTAPLLYEESIIAAADLVAVAHAYIGMDAGMTHVAALAGVNTLALFGPTDPAVWRPLGRRVHVLPFPTDSSPSTGWIQKIERCVRMP